MSDERLSTTVGAKYRVVRFVAKGGMGSIYEARHALVRRRFAVKFLRRDLAGRRDALTRFRQEAQAAGALEHENIAAVVDFGVGEDGTPYLVMEYLDGCDLGSLLEASGGTLPSARAADLVRQAATGVHAAHTAGVIHRDLKPQNLFVCRRGDGTDHVKLLDFGVAKLLDDEATRTQTGARLGTPAYMSPEQARGESGIDERADVYALGVILYELLSGRTPHPGGSANAVLHHIATENAMPLEGDEVPRGLADLVNRALSQDVGARPASAAELAELLEPFASRVAWPVPEAVGSAGEPEALEQESPFADGVAGSPPGVSRPAGSGLLQRAALALVAVAVVALLAVLLVRSPAEGRESAAPVRNPGSPAARNARADDATAMVTPVSAGKPAPGAERVASPPQAESCPKRSPARQRPAPVATPPAAPSPAEAGAGPGARFDDTNPYQ